jgi:hypothetical protein
MRSLSSPKLSRSSPHTSAARSGSANACSRATIVMPRTPSLASRATRPIAHSVLRLSVSSSPALRKMRAPERAMRAARFTLRSVSPRSSKVSGLPTG